MIDDYDEKKTCNQCIQFREFFRYGDSIMMAAGSCQMAERDFVATDPYNEIPYWCPKRKEK